MCAFDEEKSPYNANKSQCSGELRHYTDEIQGTKVQYWACDHHMNEENA